MTRYQILSIGSAVLPSGSPTENFTATQKRQFLARCKELKALGVKFTVWDTRNNGLSKLFRF